MSFAGSALFFLGKRHSTLQGLQSMMYDDDAMRWKVSKLQIWQPRTFSKSMASLSSKMSWVLLSVLSLDLLKDILTIDVIPAIQTSGSHQGEATVAEIWTSLEERTEGLQRHQMETWSLLSSERYGLPEEQAPSGGPGRRFGVCAFFLSIKNTRKKVGVHCFHEFSWRYFPYCWKKHSLFSLWLQHARPCSLHRWLPTVRISVSMQPWTLSFHTWIPSRTNDGNGGYDGNNSMPWTWMVGLWQSSSGSKQCGGYARQVGNCSTLL